MARNVYIKWGKKQQSRNKRLLIVVGTKNYGKFFLKTLICCIWLFISSCLGCRLGTVLVLVSRSRSSSLRVLCGHWPPVLRQALGRRWIRYSNYYSKYYPTHTKLIMEDPISKQFYFLWLLQMKRCHNDMIERSPKSEVSERLLACHASSGHWHRTYGCVADQGNMYQGRGYHRPDKPRRNIFIIIRCWAALENVFSLQLNVIKILRTYGNPNNFIWIWNKLYTQNKRLLIKVCMQKSTKSYYPSCRSFASIYLM